MTSSRDGGLPQALALLSAELEAVAGRFDGVAAATDEGARRVGAKSLLEAVERHVRLEREVLLPALERTGAATELWRSGHAQIDDAIAASRRADVPGRDPALARVRRAFDAHRAAVETCGLALAARALSGAELSVLAVELEELRTRLAGAYGV